mgnify:CR=1 FL=1
MVNDPYEILGVQPGASQAEIKAAYRELVKKYHPDKYQGNPLADLAEEKLQEVNEAYDMLTRGASDAGPAYGSAGGGFGSSQNFGEKARVYNIVRGALDRNDFYTAEQTLIGVRDHDAEWFFLSGVLSFKKGFVADGIANVKQAMDMDPTNPEYQNIYQQMNNSGSIFRNQSNAQGYNQNSGLSDALMACVLCNCLTPC